MRSLVWIFLLPCLVQSDALKQNRLKQYQNARARLIRYCETHKHHAAARWITQGTYVAHDGDHPTLVVVVDQGPLSQTLVADLMKKLTSPGSKLGELAGIVYRIVVFKIPSDTGWASAREWARYQDAREQLLNYAENEAGSDSDAALGMLTRGTYVRRNPKRGVKLMLISQTAEDTTFDYSGLTLDDVMQHFTHPSSELTALHGIQYEIRYVPASQAKHHEPI